MYRYFKDLLYLGAFGCLIANGVLVSTIRAADPPHLEGAWRFDPAESQKSGGGRNPNGPGGGRGGGIGLGAPSDVEIIVQDATGLQVESRIGDRTIRLSYSFDGKPVSNTIALGRGRSADSVFRSKWHGDRLETMITAQVVQPNGMSQLARFREVRHLDRDGRMIVETTRIGARGGRKTAYTKQPALDRLRPGL